MKKYALKNMHLLNGHADMKPETGLAVLVSDGKFERILPEAEIPAGYEVKDLGGKYLLPGLINLHVHIPASGKPKKGKTDYHKIAAHVESTEGLKVALENGVDTIEHGGRPTDENMKMFHETGAVLVATISPVLPFSVMDQAVSGVSDMDLLNG